MKAKIVTLGIVGLMMLAGLGTLDAEARGPKGPTIVDVAVAVNASEEYYGNFSILIAAVTATPDVLDILTGNGQHTVFAPTDQAFEDLAEELEISLGELVTFLLENPDYLEDVLVYHIAHGRLYAEDVLDKDRINTLRKGQDGFLMQCEGVLTDNLGREANIIVTDVPAANGIIHVIDAVVLPYDPFA